MHAQALQPHPPPSLAPVPRRRGRPRKEPEAAEKATETSAQQTVAATTSAEIERLRKVASRLASRGPERMSDAELQDVIVWQSSDDVRMWPNTRALLATQRALWLEAWGPVEGHKAWRRSLADICRRGRGQAPPM